MGHHFLTMNILYHGFINNFVSFFNIFVLKILVHAINPLSRTNNFLVPQRRSMSRSIRNIFTNQKDVKDTRYTINCKYTCSSKKYIQCIKNNLVHSEHKFPKIILYIMTLFIHLIFKNSITQAERLKLSLTFETFVKTLGRRPNNYINYVFF